MTPNGSTGWFNPELDKILICRPLCHHDEMLKGYLDGVDMGRAIECRSERDYKILAQEANWYHFCEVTSNLVDYVYISGVSNPSDKHRKKIEETFKRSIILEY